MPITQDRMIALIQDAKKSEKYRKDLIHALRATARNFGENLLGAEEAIALILDTINSHHDPVLSALILEESHFDKVARKNEKQKRYMEGQRRLAGVPQGHTAQVSGREKPTDFPSTPTIQFTPEYWAGLKKKQQEWEEENNIPEEPPKAGENIF